MGFPYESASWDVVDGAMFVGAGGAAPGLYTFIAAVVCVVVLWKGNKSEHDCYAKVEK